MSEAWRHGADLQCEPENFTPPWRVLTFIFQKLKIFKQYYTHILSLNIHPTAKFRLIISNFDKVMLY